jgi:hypothetical protein
MSIKTSVMNVPTKKLIVDDPVTSIASLGTVARRQTLERIVVYVTKKTHAETLPFLKSVDCYLFRDPRKCVSGYGMGERLSSEEERRFLEFLKEREREHRLVIVGNGGHGGCGVIKLLATLMPDHTVCWHGGDSDVNMENMFAMHAAITYEPHMELKLYQEHKGTMEMPRTIWVNYLGLCCPDPDAGRAYAKMRFPRSWNEYERLGFFLYQWAHAHPKTFLYVSRYNHSAIGEHDRMLMVFGAHRFAKRPSEVQRVLREFVDRFVVRDQFSNPENIARTAADARAFHLNDLTYAPKGATVVGPVLHNPAQLWFTPTYSIPWANTLRAALTSSAMQRYLHPHTSITARPTSRYVDAYLRRQYEMMQIAEEHHLHDWVVHRHRNAQYVSIKCGKATCRVNSSKTFRDAVVEHRDRRIRRSKKRTLMIR